jgi:hypothetical protein
MSIGKIDSEAALAAFIRSEIDRATVGVQVRQLQGRLLSGTGSPENVVAAPVGTLYSRTDGGPGTTLYCKEAGGSGDTGWTAMP